MTYLVTGHTFTPPVTSGAAASDLATVFLPTSGLSVGSHTLTIEYSGNGVYNPASVTSPFTVATAAPGTAFTCSAPESQNITASVVATGTLSSTVADGKATVTTLDVTLHSDPVLGPTPSNPLTSFPFQFSPGGSSSTPPPVNPTDADGTTSSSWTGLTAATIPVTGAPGSEVPVGIKTVEFVQNGRRYTCGANSAAAHIGTVQVPGTTLAVNPAGPVTAGTAVTLTATVYPAPATGGTPSQVQFFDGSTAVGTKLVSTTGSSRGTASLTLSNLAVGNHSLTATWSGNPPAVPFSVSPAPWA